MKLFFSILVLATMAGCAGNFIRITKLDSAGQWNPFVTARISGYMIEKTPDMNGVNVTYDGKDESLILEINE